VKRGRPPQLSAAVAAASEEMVAKDSRLHLSTSALAAGSTISLNDAVSSITLFDESNR
jgi:hypothetical protein